MKKTKNQSFTAKYIFDGTNLLKDTAVIVDNGIIADVIPIDKVVNSTNYGNCIITSGFIDLQLNGCGGVLFNDDISHKTLETMYQTCLKYGTTSFLPTLITCEFKHVITALESIKSWFDTYGFNRGIIGLHLEGPFISKEKPGIHQTEFILQPTEKLLTQIARYVQYFPIKLTIAPEVFTEAQIKFLIQHNIIVSLGHSNATYSQAEAAIKLGTHTSTHIFNAMSGLSARNPGVIGAILNTDVYAGVIADILHVSAANIQLLHKVKPIHTYLVTDAVTPMGTRITQFKFAGKTLHLRYGLCVDENNTIGASNLTMPEAVANCVSICGINICNALNMASLIPAQLMGYGNKLGKIKPGYRANLISFNPANHICQIIS